MQKSLADIAATESRLSLSIAICVEGYLLSTYRVCRCYLLPTIWSMLQTV